MYNVEDSQTSFKEDDCKVEVNLNDNSLTNNKMTFNLQDSRSYLASDIQQPTWWQRRTRMEKRMVMGVGFITVTSLAFLIALVVLATRARTEDEFSNLIRSSIKTISSHSGNEHPSRTCTTPGCLDAASQIMQSLDTTINPCDDFYRFSCGNWVRTHPIPDDKANVHLFSVTTDKLMLQLRNEIEVPKKPDEGPAIHTAKDIYEACMNVAVADSRGLPAFKEWLKELGGWPIASGNWDGSEFDWQKINVRFMKEGSDYLISANANVDVRNNSAYILYIGLGGTALQPDFLLSPRKYATILAAYRTQIRTVAKLLSTSDTIQINETDIDGIIQLETMLARMTNTAILKVGIDNLANLYNKMTITEVNNATEGKFDWLPFLNDLYSEVRNITENELAVVSLPTSLPDFFDNFKNFDNRTVANYLLWRYTLKYIWHINNETRLASFDYQRVVSGAIVQPARWLACINFMNDQLGEVVGSIYTRDIVPRNTKEQAEEMITDLRKIVDIILSNSDWMDEPTMEKAKIKAEAIIEFVAYPDWSFNNSYLDGLYEDLNATPVDLDNYRQIQRLMGKYALEELDEVFYRNEWVTAASTVNAFYSSTKNAIIFPAGILQPPFFSPTNLKAMNYGAIGSVIGHEITHGFDDTGRQNDENGNLNDWWTNSSDLAYRAKTTCIRQQYGAYCNEALKQELNLTTTPCVDTNNTLSENIADNGGMKVALMAYNARTQRDGEEPKLPGLTKYTSEQLFFISFAQIWCENSRPQKQFQTFLSDVHSPSQHRVLGVLSNFADFANAFQCPPNSTMNPQKKCSFW